MPPPPLMAVRLAADVRLSTDRSAVHGELQAANMQLQFEPRSFCA